MLCGELIMTFLVELDAPSLEGNWRSRKLAAVHALIYISLGANKIPVWPFAQLGRRLSFPAVWSVGISGRTVPKGLIHVSNP